MKIGIVSDVHGDIAALNRALAHFDADPAIELILNAGDLVGRGPAQDDVVAAIRERGIPSVRGNHDECDDPLRPDHLAFLHGLPLDWRGSLGEWRIFMCHGKPGNNLWGLYRDHASDAFLAMMLAGLQTDVLVTGHTHVPLSVVLPGGIVVNPGSLYTFPAARASSCSYGILDLAKLEFTVHSSKESPATVETIASAEEHSLPI
ncbi:MAG: YfcE family phosphodiesterase [Chloroflexi bacterium]|nr:YfcE family phosphodiesterase [Chloroflexota bacterium]